MSGSLRSTRMRAPFMSAFRSAFESRDARLHVEEATANGERVVAGRRSTGRSGLSEADLQRSVAHDLEALLNTVHLGATLDLDGQAHVRRSVLNFGFPDLVHRTIDEGSLRDIGHEIETVLSTFEPRIVRGSIEVERDEGVDAAELKIRFVVRAELDCDPLNVPVEFVADLERDTGKITVGRT